MTTEEFEHLMRRLRPKLLGIGRKMFADSTMAEDVAQETLMRLWMMRERIDSAGGAEALAVRIARNVCVSEWRRKQSSPCVAMPLPGKGRGKPTSRGSGTLTARGSEELAIRDSMKEPMAESDNSRILQIAVSRLTPSEQRLYRMRHELEMDLGEIAAVTGIGARSLSAMLSTARRKMLETIKKEGLL